MDSYDKFFNRFNIKKEDFYKFGLEETIYPDIKSVDEYWEDLKDRVVNNKIVYIRGYGRDAKGTELYKKFHDKVFRNRNVIKDPSNNSIPQKIISELTGYKRNKNIFNYQVSHIFGKTRNALMFEAPWNIVLVPKIMDPLTGHESKGEWPKEYQKLFLNSVFERYEKYIKEYNEIIKEYNLMQHINEFVINDAANIDSKYSDKKDKERLKKNLKIDFSVIEK